MGGSAPGQAGDLTLASTEGNAARGAGAATTPAPRCRPSRFQSVDAARVPACLLVGWLRRVLDAAAEDFDGCGLVGGELSPSARPDG
jgi:hypothetical protein